MNKKNKSTNSKPFQQSLEVILKSELEIKTKVSAAKDLADKRIEAARKEIDTYKSKIITQARKDRDQLLAKGIAAAKIKAQERIEQAAIESKHFEDAGSSLVDKAAQEVIAVILGNSEGQEL
ncbi:MAG: hypothetical protein J7L66_02855 [Anaerolineaceae bacterium]|nr:hypothetical protein [Anaerolineaceae bacterium]